MTVLAEHELAAAMPAMQAKQYAALVADIRANGLREPITVFEGRVLDGRHRYRACVEIGIEPALRQFAGTREQATAYVESLNVKRRHLTQEQQRARIRAELARDPAQSDRAVARKAGVSHHTVAKERCSSNGQSAHKPDRKEADGRKARGRKPDDGAPRRDCRSGPTSNAERAKQIAALAATGHGAAQVAHELGVGEAYVRKIAVQHRIAFAIQRGTDSTRRLPTARMVAETVNILAGAAQGIELLRGRAFEAIDAAALMDEFTVALRAIHWFGSQLKEAAHG